MTMRIDLRSLVAGLPAADARRFVQLVLRSPFERAEGIAEYRGFTIRRVLRFAKRLEDAGFLEVHPETPRRRVPAERRRWTVTRLGVKLANATAAAPIKRTTADRLLSGVLDRARVLADPTRHEFAYVLAELRLFGSYLAEVPHLNDLDLCARWVRRFDDGDAHLRCVRERVRAATDAGRTFHNVSCEYNWPYVEARRFLTGRSRAISLHDFAEDPEFYDSVTFRVLWPPQRT